MNVWSLGRSRLLCQQLTLMSPGGLEMDVALGHDAERISGSAS